MIAFLQRWVVNTVAVLVAANIVSGIRYDSLTGLFVASLMLGVLNAFLRPVMLLVSLPLVVFSFGFFALVINGLLLYLVGQLVKGFHVQGFHAAFWGALIVSLVSLAVNALVGRSRPAQGQGPRRAGGGQGGSGPVIDV